MNSQITLGTPPRFYKQLLAAKNPVAYFNTLNREFGDFVSVRGFLDFYFVNHPELVGYALLNKAGTLDRITSMNKVYQRIGNIGRGGLATSEHAHWRKQRRVVAPLFTATTIRGFGESMIASAEAWLTRWDAMSRTGQSFDMKDETNELSLEVNTTCLFAADVGEDQRKLQAWFSVMKEYLEAFPYPLVTEWWFPSPLNVRTKRALAGFDQYAHGLIARRREQPLDADSKDLVGRMLQARDTETGQGMTDEEICHEMLTFLIAGYESTSSALLWTFYHLTQNPVVEAAVHAEVDRVVGDGSLVIGDVPKLSYTRRVIDEVMRITPSVWFMARTTTADIELAGHAVPSGSHLAMSIPAVHHHPDFWPDPERFDPDRFLPENVAKRAPNSYIPFGRGPHACIGSHFSTQELVILTAVLCSRFRVVMDETSFDASDVRAGLSVYPRHGIRMRVERRRQSLLECAE